MIALIFVLIVIFVTGTLVGLLKIHQHREAVNARGMKIAEFEALSWPSQRLSEMYQRLPEANRPDIDIYQILRAFDVKHGASQRVENINNHFTPRYQVQGWSCRCQSNLTRAMNWCADYHEMRETFEELEEALEKQRRALELSDVSGSLAEAEILLERLRIERDLVDEVTKELS